MASWAYTRHVERTLEAQAGGLPMRRTVTRTVFCMCCGIEVSCEVAPPDECSATTYDGTLMQGWCNSEGCREARERFLAACDRIMSGSDEISDPPEDC